MRTGNFKGALHGANLQGLGLIERHFIAQLEVRCAARSELVAVGAIDLQVGTGADVEIRLGIIGAVKLIMRFRLGGLFSGFLRSRRGNQADML